MPLYEYQCDACSHRFEKIQKFSDPLEDTCPKCGGAVHKLFSSPAIQFKGSGFYITDYAKKDHVAAAKADSAAGDKASKSESAGKSETSEKSEKSEKSAKSDKSESSSTSEKSTSTSAASSSGSSDSSSASSSPAPKTAT
jgi:putative FmdB family regulatory protein